MQLFIVKLTVSDDNEQRSSDSYNRGWHNGHMQLTLQPLYKEGFKDGCTDQKAGILTYDSQGIKNYLSTIMMFILEYFLYRLSYFLSNHRGSLFAKEITTDLKEYLTMLKDKEPRHNIGIVSWSEFLSLV